MLEGLCLIALLSFMALPLLKLDDGRRFVDVDIRAERDRALKNGDIQRALKAQKRLDR